MPEELNSRVAYILAAVEGSNEVLAEKLGVNKNTISAYKNGKGGIKGIVLERLVSLFGVRSQWLLSGEGEPFRRQEGNIYNEGEEKTSESICAPVVEYHSADEKWDNMGLGEAVEKLSKIYNAGDPTLIRAINANLDAFARTVDMAEQIESLTARMERMEKIINDLQSREHCCIRTDDAKAAATGSAQGETK